jgi:kynurenine formamidase
MRILDLSLPITAPDPYRPVQFEPLRTIADFGANVTRVVFDTHWGTHLDAPSHTLPGAPTVDQVPLERCYGAAVVLPLAPLPERHRISVGDLEPLADAIAPKARLLLYTGWSLRYGRPDYTEGYPVIGLETAHWLAERGVWLVGVDTPSVGPVYEPDRTELVAVHAALLGAGIVVLENLTNLQHIPGGRCTLIALPLSFRGLDGSPVRAVALCEEASPDP